MCCTRCGTESPPTDTDEPVDWAARNQITKKSAAPSASSARSSPPSPAPPRLGPWTKTKVRENRLRRVAPRQGLTLIKSQSRESLADDSSHYRPATVDKDSGLLGCRLPVGRDAGMTLDGVEEYLTYRTTRAEIMEYLNQAYGPAFVEDLIKHLPQLRAEKLNVSQLCCRITASATVS